ncbi:response regulator transcription factor [Microbacterium sp. CPCC 204701]|uniref:response regulator transcription factor n=1 Tax=Microbacterium sp. CPCC 204701 TaxID=2493084 RepID=UPI001F0BBFB5|nr:response regulator transcription factor [Microbacterium sp. CPCC 204701]
MADDESAFLRSVARSLAFEGYDVLTAVEGEQALDVIARSRPEIIVLDVTMPRTDGLSVCRRLRSTGDRTPVLMLTARDSIGDRVAGLDAGADDYLVKPFAYAELLARLRALRRRLVGDRTHRAPLECGPLRLDSDNWAATVRGEQLMLTRTEFALLEMLMRHIGQVLTRSQLYAEVWSGELDEESNAAEVYVGYLRRKLSAAGLPDAIRTVRGVGYALRVDA